MNVLFFNYTDLIKELQGVTIYYYASNKQIKDVCYKLGLKHVEVQNNNKLPKDINLIVLYQENVSNKILDYCNKYKILLYNGENTVCFKCIKKQDGIAFHCCNNKIESDKSSQVIYRKVSNRLNFHEEETDKDKKRQKSVLVEAKRQMYLLKKNEYIKNIKNNNVFKEEKPEKPNIPNKNCCAKTKSGKSCSNKVIGNSNYCGIVSHRKLDPNYKQNSKSNKKLEKIIKRSKIKSQ